MIKHLSQADIEIQLMIYIQRIEERAKKDAQNGIALKTSKIYLVIPPKNELFLSRFDVLKAAQLDFQIYPPQLKQMIFPRNVWARNGYVMTDINTGEPFVVKKRQCLLLLSSRKDK